MKRSYLAGFCVLSWLVLMLSGCQKGGIASNAVEGTIQWNGQPVAEALVTFQAQGDSAITAIGTTDEQGKYQLTAINGEFGEGTVAGHYKVLVTKIPNGAVGPPSRTTQLPGVYAEVPKTPLEVDVVKGKNTFDFTLEGPAAAPVKAK